MEWSNASTQLKKVFRLEFEPVAISFCNAPPPGVIRIDKSVPSSCTFWRMAAEGQSFYTEPSDHQGCPIGVHTHGLQPDEEKAGQLGEMVKMLIGLEYIQEAEVSKIPTLRGGFRFAVYAPLSLAPLRPDLVLVRGNARELMLATEVARAAGLEGTVATRQRPTCAIIAEIMETSRAQSSLGCVGNRVYTGLSDQEFYFGIPGPKLEAFINKVTAVSAANDEVERFHRSRLAAVN
jgi:uncharacterized protein (DUF169 family)